MNKNVKLISKENNTTLEDVTKRNEYFGNIDIVLMNPPFRINRNIYCKDNIILEIEVVIK